MAKVQLQAARMGYEFQGAEALSVVGAWLDSDGAAETEEVPVTPLNVEDMADNTTLPVTWES